MLLKRPDAPGEGEQAKLGKIRRANNALYRAYLLKETFLDVFTHRSAEAAREALEAWLA